MQSISSNNFSYKNKTFTAFASDGDLHALFRSTTIPSELVIKSEITMNTKKFKYVTAEKDREGDVIAFVYKADDLIVKVWND